MKLRESVLTMLAGLILVPSSAYASSEPHYGGGHHTSSHGGSYGVRGSSHKGGHYTSRTGSHHYGTHK